jgi:hypothetical protein
MPAEQQMQSSTIVTAFVTSQNLTLSISTAQQYLQQDWRDCHDQRSERCLL